MALKIHGVSRSTCTQRAATALVEKGVSYDLVLIDMAKGEHKSPAHLKLQPFGKIPVLDDDGSLIYESRAIAKYVAQKYAGQGTKLVPDVKDLLAYAKFEEACSIEQSYFDGPASGIAFEKIFKAMKGLGATDDAAVAKHAAALDATLAVYDGILANQKFLAGDEITLADLFHLPYGKLTRDLGFKDLYEKYPNVNRWWNSLETRESWKKVTSA